MNPPKKILFVIESLAIGGAEKSLVNLLNTLDFSEWQVDVMLSARDGLLEKEVPEKVRLLTTDLHYPTLARLKFLFKRKTTRRTQTEDLFWQTFGKHIKPLEQHYDVAVAYSQGFATYFVAEKVKAEKKLAWVNTDYEKAGYNAGFDIDFYKKFNGIVTVSDASFSIFKRIFQPYRFSVPIHTIEDLLGVEKIREKSLEPVEVERFDGLKLVSVGRLHPAKGFDLAVGAAEILKNKRLNFRWWIVGEGSERTTLEKLITEKNLQEYVILVGADANPYRYMRAADIYVQTSVYEGFSITVREALALDRLVISTDFPSVFSAITNGENGLISQMNATDIAQKIMLINNNHELAEKIKKSLSADSQKVEQSKKIKLHTLLLKS